MPLLFALILLVLLPIAPLRGQDTANSAGARPSYHLLKTGQEITVDGLLNEDIWNSLPVAANFYQNYPYDTSYAQTVTEVRLTFDKNNLYIAAICYDSLEGPYVAQSLVRDYALNLNDAFGIYLDPLNDNTNGFHFAVSALGVQREGIVTNGGGGGASTAWDNKWFSAVQNYPGRWVAEIAIPFKSIRYDPAVSTWGLNLVRIDLKRNENSSWAPVPRTYSLSTLGYAGELQWNSPPPKAGMNLAMIPYLKTSYQEVKGATRLKEGIHFDGGGDAKIGITSSLNLDITVNPDFSEAEVDDQVINLERFSIFFPERRNFFQENSDLFANFGFSKIRPFFSRKIGLDQQSGKVVPIIAGARLSGKVNANWRIGAMSMQTAALPEEELPGQNYSVAAVQRQVGKASNISAILVNKQAFDTSERRFLPNDFNRVAGLEYNFSTLDNRWRGKAFYQQSFSPGQEKDAMAHASWLLYNTNKWNVYWNHEYVGRNFNAEAGFVQRGAYWRLEPGATRYFYPENKVINRWGPFVYMSLYTDLQYQPTENLMQTGLKVDFQNSAYAQWNVSNTFIRLLRDFNATGIPCDTFYLAGNSFETYSTSFSFTSNYRKPFYFNVYTDYGGYYSGKLLSYGGSFSYRAQPYAVFSLKIDRREIVLPDPYCSAYLTLIGPRVQMSFTRSLFLTTYLQYNDQAQNVNLNTRLQWRFKPMSDVFLVYNSNYDSDDLLTKGQRFILKFNWWLNV